MAISSIEHRSGWYDIFDARGKKTKTISHNIGELLGWSDRFFIVRRSSWYDTYDEQGNKIKSNLSQQTSATLFLSVLISLSSDEVHGLIHMMLGERR